MAKTIVSQIIFNIIHLSLFYFINRANIWNKIGELLSILS